jgi:hypothetical protein
MDCTAAVGWRWNRIPAIQPTFLPLQLASTRTLLHNIQTSSGAHPASYSVVTVILPRDKRPGREVNHCPPSSAMFENGWCLTSTLQIRRHGGGKENCAFFRRFGPYDLRSTVAAVVFTTEATGPNPEPDYASQRSKLHAHAIKAYYNWSLDSVANGTLSLGICVWHLRGPKRTWLINHHVCR